MADSIVLSSGKTLDTELTDINAAISALQTTVNDNFTSVQSSIAAVNKALAADQATDQSSIDALQTALTSVQSTLAAWMASKGSTASGSTASGSTASGSTASGSTTNTENLSLVLSSAYPADYAFSNLPPNNSTIAIINAVNSKQQYPSWSILRSNTPLSIDYAGYVHPTAPIAANPITFQVQCTDTVGNSTTTGTFSIPVVQYGVQSPTRVDPTYSGLPTSGIINTPTFLTPSSGSADVVGFNIINATASPLPAGFTRFVQAFVKGDVPSGYTLSLSSGRGSIQVDPVNTHSDGSLKTAVITVNYSTLSAGATESYMLAKSAIPATKPTSVNLSTALTSYTLSLSYQLLNTDGSNQGSLNTTDIVVAVKSAISANTISYFREGPLVTEGRVVIPLRGSLYLNVDMSAYSDGSILTDISFRNDIVMGATGGPIYTSGYITENGTKVYSWNQLFQTQYQAWFYTCGTLSSARTQIDPSYLIKAAAIQPYNLTLGVDASTITGYETAISSFPTWLEPLATNIVDTGMPGTGGRPDIGYLTQSATVAFITGDPRVIDYCCAQADASGSAPWNYYDMANGHWISTADYPIIWLDQANRGGNGSPGNKASTGPTQPTTPSPQSWALDQAHQPDLAFGPWFFTGKRIYLDQVLAQGAWSVAGAYARNMTIPGTTTVIAQSLWNGQVRGIAWNIRQVSDAAYCAPDNTSYATYFPSILNDNSQFGTGLQTYLQANQGACYGYLAQGHGQNNFAPWEQNYLQPICAITGARGYTSWSTIAAWFARFTVESFIPQTDGPYKGANWCQNNGASYELFCGATSSTAGNSAGVTSFSAQDWAQLEYWTVVGGQSNGGETYDATTDTVSSGTPNWSHSAGDYGQLCLAALNWAVKLSVPNASTALQWFSNAGAPYTDTASLQSDPTFSLS